MKVTIKNLNNCEAAKKALYECGSKGYGSIEYQECVEEKEIESHVGPNYIVEQGAKLGKGEQDFFRYFDKDNNNFFSLEHFNLKCIDQHTAELVNNVAKVIYRHPYVEIRKVIDGTDVDSKRFVVTLVDPKVSDLFIDDNLNGLIFKMENGTKIEWNKVGRCEEVNAAEDQTQEYKGGSFCLKAPDGGEYNIANICDSGINVTLITGSQKGYQVHLHLKLCEESAGGSYTSDNIDIMNIV